MKFQDQNVLSITSGNASALFAPEHGGRLLKWTLDGQDIIFWPDNADWHNLRKVRGGNPLLFPFVGRHYVNGQIGHWQDAQGTVRAMPTHGFAQTCAFAAQPEPGGTGMTMTLHDTPQTCQAYPFAFEFSVHYRLLDNALQVTLTTRNSGTVPLPYYAGHHFYFALPNAVRGAATLQLPPHQRQGHLPDGSLSAAEPGLHEYTFDDARLQDRFHILQNQDALHLRLPGQANFAARRISVQLQAPDAVPWHAVGTWADSPAGDSFCVEPWLGLPSAIHNAQGLRWLQPGQQEQAVCTIAVQWG